jgi:hypothetical protein
MLITGKEISVIPSATKKSESKSNLYLIAVIASSSLSSSSVSNMASSTLSLTVVAVIRANVALRAIESAFQDIHSPIKDFSLLNKLYQEFPHRLSNTAVTKQKICSIL